MATTVEFTEEMSGFAKSGESDCERGEQGGQSLMVQLTIRTEDINLFLIDPNHKATIEGDVSSDIVGGNVPVNSGEFDCLVDTEGNSREMRYRLYLRDADHDPLTLSGVKRVRHDGIQNIWRDTSTLFIKIFRGHIDTAQETAQLPISAGIVRIGPLDFVHQLTTFRGEGGSFAEEVEAVAKFGKFFMDTLWDVYKPKRGPVRSQGDKRAISLFTLSGVKGADISTHYVSTADHLGLNLLRFRRAPCKDVVVLLHGLTTSSDMFIMPEHYNIVNYLLDHQFTDVWSFDWRGSMRYSYDLFPADFTMDDIALYDMPAAFSKIRRTIGPDARIHVVCHCVGSLTFMMSLYAGLLDGITSVISNSVSLTPRIPGWCRAKLAFAPLIFPQPTDLNPRWAYYPGVVSWERWLTWWLSLWHRECQISACHIVSFMWGSGHPAPWMHQNLDEVTHQRTGDLFGPVNINYFRHIRKMVARGEAVKMYPNDSRYDLLPNNYLDRSKNINTPILFVTGENNRVFLDSNVRTFHTLEGLNPVQPKELHTFPGYGHQDPFMGKNSHKDIFPVFLNFLERHSSRQC